MFSCFLCVQRFYALRDWHSLLYRPKLANLSIHLQTIVYIDKRKHHWVYSSGQIQGFERLQLHIHMTVNFFNETQLYSQFSMLISLPHPITAVFFGIMFIKWIFSFRLWERGFPCTSLFLRSINLKCHAIRIVSLVSFQDRTTTVTSSRSRSSSTKLNDLVNFQRTTGFHTEAIRRWVIEETWERTWLADGIIVSNQTHRCLGGTP